MQEPEITVGGSGDSTFRGMLDEVRVWNTWLHDAEVAGRCNVRLCGDEPDLLACWRFDDAAVLDASPNQLGHDPVGPLSRWLTDLSFEQPRYPFLTASTKAGELVTAPLSEGHGRTITSATFTTTITARRADGTPRPETELTIDIAKPASGEIQVASGATSAGGHDGCTTYSAKAGTDGRAVLRWKIEGVDSHKPVASPVLEVNADFMYPNERFLVSSVRESQRHVTLPPPTLTVKSAMLQDYDWAPGDTLGTKGANGEVVLQPGVDITAIRTTITALSGDGSPLPGEDLEIWADDHVTVECQGTAYPVNKSNSVKLKTGHDGTVVLVIPDKSTPDGNLLDVPTLQVRAGFMPRSARVVFGPAEQGHKTLSQVTGDQVAGRAKLTADRPNRTPLVPQEIAKQTDSSESVAKALNQMARLTAQHEPQGTTHAGGSGTPLWSGAQGDNPDLAPPDAVASILKAAHQRYRAPITPDYMSARHFVVSLDGMTMTYTEFHSAEDLDAHLKTKLGKTYTELTRDIAYGGPDDPAGGWFKSLKHHISSAWHSFKHGVTQAWNKAKHFVVKTWDEAKKDLKQVAHFVEVTVADDLNAIGKWVIKTVKDVVTHVVAFLKKIGTLIKDVINFLRALFDWPVTLEIHDVLRETINQNLQGLKADLQKVLPQEAKRAFADAKKALDKALGATGSGGGGALRGYGHQASGTSAKVLSHAGSNKSHYLHHKIREHGHGHRSVPRDPFRQAPTGDPPFGEIGALTSQGDLNLNQAFQQLVGDLQALLDQPGGLTALTPHELLSLVEDLLTLLLDLAEDVTLAIMYICELLVAGIKDLLNQEIHIPFISDLYKLITGGDSLTILDVLCLLVAIPVHLVGAVIGLPKFDKGEFKSAAGSNALFGNSQDADLAARQSFGASQTESVSAATKWWDVSHLIFVFFNGLLSGAQDILQGNINAEDPEETGNQAKEEVNVGTGMFLLGLASHITAILAQVSFWIVCGQIGRGSRIRVVRVLEFTPSVLHAGAMVFGVRSQLAGAAQTYGKVSVKGLGKVPKEPLMSLVGLAAVLASMVTTLGHWDQEDGQDRAEGLITLVSGLNLAFTFLIWGPVALASEVDGVPTSPLAKGAMDFAVSSVTAPVVHLMAGYGKEVL